MSGWSGRVLRVDLSRERITREPLDRAIARKFIGGRGLNSHTLYKEIRPGIDPLGPENVLCFAPGPFTNTPLRCTGRVEVSTLSPLTSILGDGNGGASFAVEVKAAGYDQIVITGRADRPVYLSIYDESAELRDAPDLWGLSTWETTDALIQKHGRGTSVASIGQAGEHLVRFASTIFDKYSSAARGSGAVLGSKNLKAIAVRGTGKTELADPEVFKELAHEDSEFLRNDPLMHDIVKVFGSHIGMERWHPGVRNSSYYLSEGNLPEDLRPLAWKKYEIRRTACRTCILMCKNVFSLPSGETAEGLEYEAMHCLGTNCGIFDPEAIMEMANLADKYGMCVIGLGNAIALAKDLFNRGIISQEECGGLSLEWADARAQIQLIHWIASRQGFGSMVAEGMYSLAKLVGRGAMDYCYHVKGLGRGIHKAGIFSLAHATSTRGADHLRGRSWAFGDNDPELFQRLQEEGFIPGDPVGALVVSERGATLADLTGRCKGSVNSWVCAVPLVFRYPLFEGAARLLSAATGVPYDENEIAEALDRVYLLEMAFNARQGITRHHDRLPQRPEERKTPAGQKDLREHNRMLTRYYELRGCDPETGIPGPEILERLGLGDVADELSASAPYPEWQGPPLWDPERYP